MRPLLHRWSADASGNEYVVMELVPLGSLDTALARFGCQLRSSAKFQAGGPWRMAGASAGLGGAQRRCGSAKA